jgi:hypothetical protein
MSSSGGHSGAAREAIRDELVEMGLACGVFGLVWLGINKLAGYSVRLDAVGVGIVLLAAFLGWRAARRDRPVNVQRGPEDDAYDAWRQGSR